MKLSHIKKRLKISFYRTLYYMFRYTPLLLAFTLSCQQEETHIDPKLKPYVDLFIQEAKKHNHHIDISQITVQLADNLYSSDGMKADGLWQGYVNSNKGTISIDHTYFNTADAMCIERTVFHEFGHAMGRHHITGILSIMNVAGRYDCYSYSQELREQMINELFNPAKP